jgi:hypothetical protein
MVPLPSCSSAYNLTSTHRVAAHCMPLLCGLHSMHWQPRVGYQTCGKRQALHVSPQQHALQVLGVNGAAAVIVLSPQVNKLVKVVRPQLPALQQAATRM